MEQHLTRLGEEDLTLREIFIILGIKPDLPCKEFWGVILLRPSRRNRFGFSPASKVKM
jgi:hypothetical protein